MTLIVATAEDEFESHESSFADIIERLFLRFESSLSLKDIVAVVRDAREQLRGSPLGALPELTERLAIERLTTLSAAAAALSATTTGSALPEPLGTVEAV